MAKCKVCGVKETSIHRGHEFALCDDCAWEAILEICGIHTSERNLTTREAATPKQTCPSCLGRGYSFDPIRNRKYTCAACDGTGQV